MPLVEADKKPCARLTEPKSNSYYVDSREIEYLATRNVPNWLKTLNFLMTATAFAVAGFVR